MSTTIPRRSISATASTPSVERRPPVPDSAIPSASIVRRFQVSDAMRTPKRCSVSNIEIDEPTGSAPSMAISRAIRPLSMMGSMSAAFCAMATSDRWTAAISRARAMISRLRRRAASPTTALVKWQT